MKEPCDERASGSSCQYRTHLHRMASLTNSTWVMSHGSGLSPRFWAEAMGTFVYLPNHSLTATNKGRTPYELFYRVKLDVEHIRTFGCVVKVVLPSQTLANLTTMQR